jgi:hypothetical protein
MKILCTYDAQPHNSLVNKRHGLGDVTAAHNQT